MTGPRPTPARAPRRSHSRYALRSLARSPTAEAVFRAQVDKNNASSRYTIDSCGTGGGAGDWYKPGGFSYHEGDAADARMTAAASQRGVKLTSRSRPLRPDDLSGFQTIVCMDAANVRAVRVAVDYWKSAGMVDEEAVVGCNVVKMTDFLSSARFSGYKEVPDPYYGGSKGFELVLDLLEDACVGLYSELEGQDSK